ncbi:MAG: heparinase II/III family protein [Akkermansiaceae bacterium]
MLKISGTRLALALSPASNPESLCRLAAVLIMGWLCVLAQSLQAAPLMEATAVRSGTTNVEWTPATQASVDITLGGESLATGKSVEMWMYLPTRAPSAAFLRVEMLGRRANLPLQWTGWRRLVFPVSAMAVTPGAYNVAGMMRLLRSGSFTSNFTINYCGGSVATVISGPGVADEDLLDHLDLSRPGLAAVSAAVEIARTSSGTDRAGSINDAKIALATYFRQNFTARWPMGTGRIASANNFVAGTFNYVGLTHTYTYLGGVSGAIDWNYNPSLQPGYTGDVTYEWGFSMNRHGHWDALTTAYNSNTASKQTYASCWAGNLRSWVEQEPAPAISDETNTSAWRGLEAGLRQSRSWPASFLAFSQSTSSVTDDDIITFLKSILDHGNFLSGRFYGPGNHYILSMCGLVTQGGVFPEFIDAPAWRQIGFANLEYSLNQNTFPDGAWYEGSPSYHDWVTDKVNEAVSTITRNGFGAAVSQELWDKLQNMSEWLVKIGAPDRSVPTLNDGGPIKISSAAFSGWDTHNFTSPLLEWADALNTETPAQNTSPDTTLRSLALPDSGYTVMRSGWGKTDHYALLDVGPLGGWHGHQDALNLVAFFHGRPFLFDNGGYKYDTSEWRDYGPSTASHNTVRVDDLDQARSFNNTTDPVGSNAIDTPPPRFGTSDAIDYASGWYVGGYGSSANRLATHRRETAFLKTTTGSGPLMVVVDTLSSVDSAAHAYDLRWHIKSTNWLGTPGPGAAGRSVWTTDANQPNLAVVSVAGPSQFSEGSAVNGATPGDMRGWFYPNQNDPPQPALTLVQKLPAAAGTTRMVTLLVPFTGTPHNPVSNVVPVAGIENAWTVSFTDNRTPVTITVNPATGNIDPSFTLSTQEMPALEPLPKTVVWQPAAGPPPVEDAGTWDSVTPNWRDLAGVRGVWEDYLIPTFGAGSPLTANHSVALTQPVALSDLRFDTTGTNQYVLANSGGNGSITLAATGRPEIFVRANALIEVPVVASAGFDKIGPGTLRLSANSSGLAGTIRVGEGLLQLGNNGSTGDLGSGTIELGGTGNFTVRRSGGALTLNNTLTGIGNVTFQTRQGFTAIINKANTYVGNTTISPTASNEFGTVKLALDNGIPISSVLTITNSGTSVETFDLNSFNQTLGGLVAGGTAANSNVTLGTGTLTINDAGNRTFAGEISGAGNVVKLGSGTWTLAGANTYTGTTSITGGTLVCTSSSALGSGNINIASGGAKLQLDFSGTREIASLSFNGGAPLPIGSYGSSASPAQFKNDGYFSGTGTVMVTVGPPNSAPVAIAQALSTPEDVTLPITLTGSDVDNHPLTFIIVSQPTKGTLSGTAPDLTYIPAANQNGPDSFTFKVNDGVADSATVTVTITITPVNDLPVAIGQNLETAEDTVLPLTFAGSDVDGDPLIFIIMSQPTKGVLSGTGADRIYTPTANQNGSDSFTFKVNDGVADSDTVTVTITITPVNDLPVAAPQVAETVYGIPLPITLAGDDVETEVLSYSIVNGPSNGTLTGTAPAITYVPTPGYHGSDSFTFLVNDGTADSLPATVTITVQPSAPPQEFIYRNTTNNTTPGTSWSAGIHWDDAPSSAANTTLSFGNESTLAAAQTIFTSNDVGSFLLNQLNMSYAGPASGTQPLLTINTHPLTFVSNGVITPAINLNATSTGGTGQRPQVVFANGVTFFNNTALGGSSDALFSGVIANSGGAVVTKTGSGTVRIQSNNADYAGNFNVTGGLLQVGNNGGTGDSGSGMIALSGGGAFTLRRNGAAALTLNNTLTGTGNVTFQTRGGFIAIVNKANDYIGSTTLQASAADAVGGIRLGLNNGLPTTSVLTITNSGSSVQTFDLGGFNQTLGGLAAGGIAANSKVTLGTGTLTINDAGNRSFAGEISGAGDVVKQGAGTWTLSGTNTYAGDTTVSEGVLSLASANATNDNSTITLATSGATLNLAFTGTETVQKLIVGTTEMPAGVYEAINHPGNGIEIPQLTGTGTLTVTSGAALPAYDSWASSKGLTAANNAKSADPDNDGSNNLAEFAFNGDPLGGSDPGFRLAAIEDTDGDTLKELTLTLAIRNGSGSPVFSAGAAPTASVDGITYTIEGALDLAFPNSNVSETSLPAGLPALPTGWEYRRFRLDVSEGLSDKGFLRTKVTAP